MRVFRDYDATDAVSSTETKIEEKIVEVVTPMKRKMEDMLSTLDFPLTPPATVKSEKISYDLKIESDELTTKDFVRRSKRRKTIGTQDDPFS